MGLETSMTSVAFSVAIALSLPAFMLCLAAAGCSLSRSGELYNKAAQLGASRDSADGRWPLLDLYRDPHREQRDRRKVVHVACSDRTHAHSTDDRRRVLYRTLGSFAASKY